MVGWCPREDGTLLVDLGPLPAPASLHAAGEPLSPPLGESSSFHEIQVAHWLLPACPPTREPVLEQKVPLSQPSTRATSSPQLSPRAGNWDKVERGRCVFISCYVPPPSPPPLEFEDSKEAKDAPYPALIFGNVQASEPGKGAKEEVKCWQVPEGSGGRGALVGLVPALPPPRVTREVYLSV